MNVTSQGGECESCKKQRVQRRAAVSTAGGGAYTPSLTGGAPLALALRARLEPRFGANFGGVRIHDDAASHRDARELGAHAFTFGQHVHFAAGRYAPDTRAGLHLLAHELAHTLQQQGAASALARDADADWAEVDPSDAPLERAADAHADAVVAGQSTRVRAGAALGPQLRLQRQASSGAAEVDRDNGDGTGVHVRRTLTERPCSERPVTRATPSDRIFRWDRDANALQLNYTLCHGSVRLSADSSIDYSRVLEAGTRLLETLRDDPSAGADLPSLARTAIDEATVSATGEISLTVDGILQASLSAESTVGTGEQQIRVTGRLRVTPNGVSFTITGFVDASRTPTLSAEQYSLNLRIGTRWFAVDLGYQVDDRRPSGEASSSRATLRVGAEIPLPNVGPLRDVTLRPGLSVDPSSGDVTPTIGLGGRFGGPDRTERVHCFECECPPPLPRYECTPYGTREVIDRAADTQRTTLLYQYDSNAPVDQAGFDARVQGVASMATRGYAIRSIRGYASPEGSVAYNQGLATRRAEHAHSSLAQQMPSGSPPLPAAEAVGEILGESSTRPGAEAANAELTRELTQRLTGLGPDERLALLGVDDAVRADLVQRQRTLDDIQAFIDGRDARGRRLAGRARWERVFPFMRRVDVETHLEQLSHRERVPRPQETGACGDADRAYIDAEHPIPPARRLPHERCH